MNTSTHTPSARHCPHVTDSRAASVIACELRGESHESLAWHAANLTVALHEANVHRADLVEALHAAIAATMPLPSPLGPRMTEHIDRWPSWVIDARAALAKAGA